MLDESHGVQNQPSCSLKLSGELLLTVRRKDIQSLYFSRPAGHAFFHSSISCQIDLEGLAALIGWLGRHSFIIPFAANPIVNICFWSIIRGNTA